MKDDRIVIYIVTDDEFICQVRCTIEFNYEEFRISLIDKIKEKGFGLDVLLSNHEMIKKSKL